MARYGHGFGEGADASPWWGEERDFAWGETRGPNVFWGRDEGYGVRGGGGYDRGVYGGSHPRYGGHPGARDGGMYYGGFAREPFMPEEAYRRHPEYARPQRHVPGRWPDHGHGPGYGGELSDGEVKREVLHRLYGDEWVDAGRIRVDVDGGVVVLRGEVDSLVEARYAWEDAWDAPGVHAVVNNLRVRMDVPADPHDAYMVQTTRHWR